MRPWRVLHVEDDAGIRRAAERWFRRLLGRDLHLHQCATVATALDALRSGVVYDVILCDWHLPDGTGARVLEAAPDRRRFVFWTSKTDELSPDVLAVTKPCEYDTWADAVVGALAAGGAWREWSES